VLGRDWWFTHGVAASLALFLVMEENLFLKSGKLFEDTYQQPVAIPKHKHIALVKCSFLACVCSSTASRISCGTNHDTISKKKWISGACLPPANPRGESNQVSS
jgi:hypothetical protein